MAFVYDQLSDTVDWRTDLYSPAYHQFLDRGGDDVGDFSACSVSPSGEYVAGGGQGDTLWVAKTTPAGAPTKVMDAPFDGVSWSSDPLTHTDIVAYAVDDEGFVWGCPSLEPTNGTIGYVDPTNPTQITRAFRFTENGVGDVVGLGAAGIFTFTMPDGSIRVLVFPGGIDNPYVYDHTKGSGTYTLRTSGGSWFPFWCFQDSNGDLWICGSTGAHPTTEVNFMRITDVTGSSPYPTPQAITVPPSVTYGGTPVGYFAEGYFIGGWGSDVQAGTVTACATVFKINLTTGAVTSADFSAAPIKLPRNPSPPDPTYYFVFKASDTTASANHGSMSRIFYHLGSDLTLGQTYNLDSWVAGDEGGNLSGADDVYTQFWADGRQAFIGQRYQNLDDNGIYDPTGDILEVADLFIYYFDSGTSGGGGGDGLTDESLRLRVWGYNLDGHPMAVFRVGPSESLIYDLSTGQFANWASPGRDNWRAHVGQNWIGMGPTTLARGYGSDVVCGDDVSGVLYVLDPTYGRDDRTTTGSDPFDRQVTGLITVDGRETVNCGAVTLSMSLGNPSQTGATINLSTSDDLGQSWYDHGDKTVSVGEYSAVVEWRALGQAKAPARLFKFTDNGAATRISSADLR